MKPDDPCKGWRDAARSVRCFTHMRFWITITIALVPVLIIGCAHTERAGVVRIRAIRFTGDTFFKPNPQPIWRFAITNTGKSYACFASGVEVRGGEDHNFATAGGLIEWPMGALAPGEGIETNMIVPAKSGSEWRGSVSFWLLSPDEYRKYKEQADKIDPGDPEMLFGLRPRDRKLLSCNEQWHH
jgi:hypothetical protein